MISRRLRVLATLMAPWLAAASLLAAPIGKPTPGSCTADGLCTPRRATWGFSNTRWRTWPGTSIDDGRAADPGAIGQEQIGETDKPDPRREDKLAPPKVDALDETPDEAPADDGELPEMPAGEAEDGDAGAEEGPGRFEPPRPGFMEGGPGLPFGEPAEGAAPAGQPGLPFGQPPAAPETTPPADLFPSNAPVFPQHAQGEDAPPALPLSLKSGSKRSPRRSARPQFVIPASATTTKSAGGATASRISVTATPPRIQRAVAEQQFSDAPPHLPQGLFENR